MSADEQLQVAVTRGSDRVIVALEGELDIASFGLLEEAVAGTDLDGLHAVVLDLRGVSFLDSTGLKAIFRIRKLVGESGRQFAVTRCSEQVQRVLSLTRLNEHLQTIDAPDALLA